QERVQSILMRAILSQRIAHAYCFWGNEGIGKDAVAIAFAKTVNCFSPVVSETSISPCGLCKSCTQMSHLQHPNLSMVFSLPTGKSGASDDDSPLLRLSDDQIAVIQEQIARKAENPYHNISIPQATQIKIASVRDVKKTIGLSQSQGGRRVVIISEADTMTTEAANAFLKTLEEPNANVTLIITTSRKDMVPQTILSRCQQIHFAPLSDIQIADALMKREGIEPQQAALISSLAQGSYSEACALLGSDTQTMRNDVVELLRAALKNSGYRLDVSHKIEDANKRYERTDIEKMLSLLLVWLRDAMTLTSSPDSHIINADQREILAKFSSVFGKRDYPAALSLVEQTIASLRQNAQVTLSLTSMLIGLRRVFAT
ncbi:MAG: AAA family ATPase, partial [Candidatus Kapabacteria bacterium]|nr:AAA family ATPase [Candidatus Kapabacteria bacterium]